MRGESALLRTGEYLVGRSCRRLPPEIRDERYREWVAELPAILHDRKIRLAPYRAVRMLGYAADTLRGTALRPGRTRRRSAVPSTLLLGLLFYSRPGDGGLGHLGRGAGSRARGELRAGGLVPAARGLAY